MSASSGVPDVACTKPKFTFPDLQLRDHGVPASETSWPRHYHDETVAPRLERQPGGAHSPAGLFLVLQSVSSSNRAAKIMKNQENHQKSMKSIDFQWKPWIFMIFMKP